MSGHSPQAGPAPALHCRHVSSLEELAATPFVDGVNALCWERVLPGDFAEVAAKLPKGGGITSLEEEDLRLLPLSERGRAAVEVMLEDLDRLQALGLHPELNAIHGYLRDAEPGPVPTDVLSWHVDSATVEADTWLCTYHGPCSEGLANEEALRRVDIPETRAALLAMFGGEDDEAFAGFLAENCFDLHYVPTPSAGPFSFGTGNLWRCAVQHPGAAVPPFIHRAPEIRAGEGPRLLLIS